MMRRSIRFGWLISVAAIVAAGAAGCGKKGPGGGKGPDVPETPVGTKVDEQAEADFDAAMADFTATEKSGDWSSCEALAQKFISAAERQKKATKQSFPEAIYNAGLVYQRCDQPDKAKEQFEAALKADPKFRQAETQLVLYEYRATGDLSATITKLERIIEAMEFQNVQALVSLASLQMLRADTPGESVIDPASKERGISSDLDRAQLNLTRALAIDDSYMPAFNQLALYYLELARSKTSDAKAAPKTKGKKRSAGLVVSGAERREINKQQLDLAALVAAQAVKKNPNYAPIHNTIGLIQVELEQFNSAIKAFARARALDPNFFEAHMNYAALSLSFRGFAEAEKAYRDALRLQPNDFEANLGLALAIRGQITFANRLELLPEAQKYLDAAKKIAPDRPETYYNEVILDQEFRVKYMEGEMSARIEGMKGVIKKYEEFIDKAGDDPRFKAAVERSKTRAQNLKDEIAALEAFEKMKKEADEAAKKAEEAKKKMEAAGGTPPPGAEAPPPADGSAPAPAPAP